VASLTQEKITVSSIFASEVAVLCLKQFELKVVARQSVEMS
jgi:hypothetical protein